MMNEEVSKRVWYFAQLIWTVPASYACASPSKLESDSAKTNANQRSSMLGAVQSREAALMFLLTGIKPKASFTIRAAQNDHLLRLRAYQTSPATILNTILWHKVN